MARSCVSIAPTLAEEMAICSTDNSLFCFFFYSTIFKEIITRILNSSYQLKPEITEH